MNGVIVSVGVEPSGGAGRGAARRVREARRVSKLVSLTGVGAPLGDRASPRHSKLHFRTPNRFRDNLTGSLNFSFSRSIWPLEIVRCLANFFM